MKKKIILIIVITAINIIELVLIKPIIPAFFGMNLMWKILYIISLYGFPLLIIIPIALLIVPLVFMFKRGNTFKIVWLNYLQNTFLGIGLLILMMNTVLVISKFGMNNNPFPLLKYSEIEGFDGDVMDLKVGEFDDQFGVIRRYHDKQIETYTNGDSAVFKIEWISNNEYRLINQGKNLGMNDTLVIKITNNTPEFYECYLKFGEYASFQKINKK